jgi:hypothetical protein
MGYFDILSVVWFVLLVVIFWSERYLQNHCPLAANSGTKACKFAVGIWFCISESSCWGEYYAYFSCQALFFSFIEIFSVTKLRRFLTWRGEVSDYICSNDVINLIWDYNLICFEFCFVFLPMLFLFRVGGCYAVTVDFDLLFLTYLYIYDVW